MTAAQLIRPLVWNAERMRRQMIRCTPGSEAGRLAYETVMALQRAEKIARALTPFDPSGL